MKQALQAFILILLVPAAGLCLHLWRLSEPPRFVFDEIYYVPAARALLGTLKDPNWVHPPLAKVLIGASIGVFGDKPWSWRFPSVIASAMAAAYFFLLARDLFKSINLAFFASIFYLTDGITFVQSRVAMLDMICVGFLLPALYYFRKEKYSLASIFFALAVCSKWSAAFALPLLLITHFRPKKFAVNFLLPSIFIYLLIYWLFGAGGHSLKTIYLTHIKAIQFHFRPAMEHPYKASWWKWVLLIRPIWYDFKEQNGIVRGILVLPNPLLWWPALLSSVLLFFNLKKEEARFILAGILCFLVPWMFSRHGGFLYYLLPFSPFLILALVEAIKKSRLLMASCLVMSIAGFVLFFPIYSAWPISKGWYHHLIWMKSWI